MRKRIEQRLMLMLPVQFNQAVRQFAKSAGSGEGAVDVRAASSLARDFAAHDGLVAVGVFEDGLDGGQDFSGSNQVCRCASAEQKADGLDENRLSRSGLTREDVEARLELDLDRLDHCKVADTKQAQHVDGTSIVSYV
jgi:hypothetical protein